MSSWSNLKRVLEVPGPMSPAQFEPTPELLHFLNNTFKVLIVGAGGLGCELIKDLALMGFSNLHVIDMDTIDISNLNRQFLFTTSDVGKAKADVAANFVNRRISGAKVVAHCAKIEDFDEDFYRQFHIVVCGLDSIVARRWMNSMLISLLDFDDDGNVDQSTIIPLVDGGTEGFKGNVRVILPGISPCIECTLDLYPPQVNFPMCTIAHTPRLAEHCVEYVRVLLWPQEKPFGENVPIDGDDPTHLNWIFDKSLERAQQYGIPNVTYRLTQGVVKRIIPAVASTNAVIAAACATEVFKIATSCYPYLNNYMNFNDAEGVYMYTFEAERNPNCIVCSNKRQTLKFEASQKLSEVIDFLKENASFQMKSPSVVTHLNGKNKTLYMGSIASTKDNLKKTLTELGLTNGHEINVTDPTNPNLLTFRIIFD